MRAAEDSDPPMSIDPLVFETIFGSQWDPKIAACQVLSDGDERWTGPDPTDEMIEHVREYRQQHPCFIGVISTHTKDCPCFQCEETR